MAQRGEAGKALGVALLASAIGGLFSAIAMFLLSQPLTKAALQFGPSDLFAVTFMGLSILTCLDSDHILTCIISGLLGLLMACVGQDKMYAVQRLTFGSRNLLAGIDMIPVLIGLFAVTEVFKQTDPKKKRLSAEDGVSGGKVNTKMPSLKEIWSIKWTMMRCSVVGTVVGILPGAGATIASFMCYTMETKLSKHPEKFGTGIIDGIAASEASNNAATGGAMVPLLSLGIPGGNAAAVMMSALTLKGVQLGPLLLTNPADLPLRNLHVHDRHERPDGRRRDGDCGVRADSGHSVFLPRPDHPDARAHRHLWRPDVRDERSDHGAGRCAGSYCSGPAISTARPSCWVWFWATCASRTSPAAT